MPLSPADGALLIEVEAELRRREQSGSRPAPATDWTFQRTEDAINAEEAKYPNIPRGLAKAVAYQESAYNPDARGDGGQAQGFFQLHKGAAKDAGIDPARRGEPDLNIPAGVKYLSMKLDQAKGHVPTALSLYNRGTPEYRGIGDPNYIQNVYKHYKPEGEKPGLLARVGRALSPASAEAATAPPTGGYTLEEVEAELARRGVQPPPEAPAPSPPTATSTPEQDAAYRASRGQQEGGTSSQATPPPTTPPGASQGPSRARLSLGDPTEAASEAEAAATVARLRASQTGAAGLQPPPADLSALAVGGGPSQQAPTVTDPAALLAGGTRQAPAPAPAPPPAPVAPLTMQGQIQDIAPLKPRGAAAVQGRVHESGIPLEAVPAMGVNVLGTTLGAAAGSLLGPVGSAAGAAIGGSLATRANTAMGLTGQEKPLLETPYANVYPSDLLGAIPLGIAGATSALKGVVRNLPGANVGRHALAAEKLEELGQRVGPPAPSSGLFAAAAAQGGNVPTPTLWREAGKVVREEKGMKKGFVSTEAMQAGAGLMDLMRQHGGQVPLAEVEKYRQRLFQKIQTTTDRAELKRLQDLYGAIHEDLALAATAGTTAGAGTLKAAIAAKRKEHAQETLTDVWSPGKGLQLQEGEHVQVYGKRIRNEVEKKLHQDKLFAGSFTAAETVDIRNTLREVGKLTRMTNPDAQGTVGSSLKWLGRLGGGLYGATTGGLEGLVSGGMMILATEGATATLRNIMLSKVGRWGLRQAIREGNGTLTHGSLAAIAALVAREAAPEAPAPAPVPTP